MSTLIPRDSELYRPVCLAKATTGFAIALTAQSVSCAVWGVASLVDSVQALTRDPNTYRGMDGEIFAESTMKSADNSYRRWGLWTEAARNDFRG